MICGIAGMSWVTPLGSDLDQVWQQVREGVVPATTSLTNPESGGIHSIFTVPPGAVASVLRQPRLRRASAISHLAVVAGLAAIANAGLTLTPEFAARTAVVFAISDGGVIYTRKFYEQIVKDGANVASPMLFPETVYNAPASHLAAQLGIDGASYTLVGDASVGMSALHFASELLDTSDVERVIVVGAEECDWILCEAYRGWRFSRTPIAEGAAALVLDRTAARKLRTHPGLSFARQRDAAAALGAVLAGFGGAKIERVIASANHTFIDRAEAAALAKHFADVPVLAPKKSFGESPGAGALQQTVAAAISGETALVTVVGLNHQVGAALVSA